MLIKKNITPISAVFKFISLFAFTTIACSTSAISFSGSSSETDPNELETMIAISLAEKVSQTLEAMPPTDAPTETPTPSPTKTEPPPSATATKADYPEMGSDLIENADGSLIFFDYLAKYSLTPPIEWMAIRPDSPEYREMWITEAADPVIINILENIEGIDPKTQRLYIIDLKKWHYVNGFITYTNLVLENQSNQRLEESFADFVLNLPDYYNDVNVISSDISETSSGIPFGVIELEWTPEGYEEGLRAYDKVAIFSVEKDHTLFIFFSTTVTLKDETLPIFDGMIDSFTYLE